MTLRQRHTLTLAALLLVTGCRTRVESQTGYLIVALDRSDSTIDRRELMLTKLDVLAGDADSARATLDLWAYDTTPVRGDPRLKHRGPIEAIHGRLMGPRPFE